MAGRRPSSGKSVKGQRRRGPSPSPAVGRLERALAEAARELYQEWVGRPAGGEIRIPVELHAQISGGRTWRTAAEPELREQIAGAVREAGALTEIYRPGRIYCFRCETSGCRHSSPPSPTVVFGGYSPTGMPRWIEFGQALIDMKHPRADVLFEGAGRSMAAAFMDAGSLKDRQLGVFGRRSKTYDIFGQVIFGFLTLLPAGSKERERAALTLQAVEIRQKARKPRMVLNVLGRLSDGSEALDALEGPFQMRVLDCIVTARRLVGAVVPPRTRGKGGRRPDGQERVVKVLRRAAAMLDRLGRQKERRTVHAQKRRVDRRPTAKALEDAVAARGEDLLWDERRRTVVVLGARSRVHVFSPAGRHITSLTLTGEEIARRRRRNRWRHLDEAQRRDFGRHLTLKED